MKKIIALFFVMISLFSFATVNDSLKLFNDEDKKIIEQKIDEIKKNKNLDTYVNTMQIGEGFQVKDPERTIILNIKKDTTKENYEVELSFSRDMDIETITEDLDEVLDASETILKQKQFKKYIITILDAVSSKLENVEISQSGAYQLTKEEADANKEKLLQGLLLITLLVIVIALVETVKKKNKRKLQRHRNNIQRHNIKAENKREILEKKNYHRD